MPTGKQGAVVGISAVCLEGPGFKSRPAHRPSCLGLFLLVFLRPSGKGRVVVIGLLVEPLVHFCILARNPDDGCISDRNMLVNNILSTCICRFVS